jgi:hypothetical protein
MLRRQLEWRKRPVAWPKLIVLQPPNQALHLTGAALLVLRGITMLQAAPACELYRSASREKQPLAEAANSGFHVRPQRRTDGRAQKA